MMKDALLYLSGLVGMRLDAWMGEDGIEFHLDLVLGKYCWLSIPLSTTLCLSISLLIRYSVKYALREYM